MISLVYNQLKPRINVFTFPLNEPVISAEGVDPHPTELAMLH